jgi:hypothetical protein
VTSTSSTALLREIERVGGRVVLSLARAPALRALLPLSQMENLAARADVTFIAPAAEAATNSSDG